MSDERPVDKALRAFLFEFVDSYEQLELLLLLHANPRAEWRIAEVCRELRIPESAALPAMEHLVRSKLAVATGEIPGMRYRYDQASPRAPQVDALARACHDDRLAIVQLMSTNAIERVRTAALRTFADAFLVGRKK
jgi:hypothetical protein